MTKMWIAAAGLFLSTISSLASAQWDQRLDLGELRAEKIETLMEFSVRRADVYGIEIVAGKNTVSISRAEVLYGDGYTEQLFSVRGLSLGQNQVASDRVAFGRFVDRVRIYGTSGLFGSRGTLRVFALISSGRPTPPPPPLPPPPPRLDSCDRQAQEVLRYCQNDRRGAEWLVDCYKSELDRVGRRDWNCSRRYSDVISYCRRNSRGAWDEARCIEGSFPR